MSDHSNGVMVACFLPLEQAEALAVEGGQTPEQLHLTLAYLGEADAVQSGSPDKLPAIVADWAETQAPLTGRIGGVGLFNKKRDDGTQTFYAVFDSPDVQEWRADLVEHLEGHGYQPISEHGFNPHVTLAYVPEGPMPVSQLEPFELRLDEVSVSIGGDRQDYPLAGQTPEVIRPENGKWVLYSKDGTKKLGTFDTRKQALKRERQIQYFKHKDEATIELELGPELRPGQDRPVDESILAQYTEQEKAVMLLAFCRGGGSVGLSREGQEQVQGLVDRGLGYLDGGGKFHLTRGGFREADLLGKAKAQAGQGVVDMPEHLEERMKLEVVSEVWPVREAGDTELTGKAWDVTLIGAVSSGEVVRRGGQEFVRSKNGRLYSCDALKTSAPRWHGVKVYDNHLTDAEFEARQGMRSVSKEWVGTIINPYWDGQRRQLRGVFQVVEAPLAQKLLNAHKSNVLSTVGLSIDTLPVMKGSFHEGQPTQVIDGFQKIYSVDLVAEPAAGGRFNRLIASVVDVVQDTGQTTEGGNLIEWIQNNRDVTKAAVKAIVQEALADNGTGSVQEATAAGVAEMRQAFQHIRNAMRAVKSLQGDDTLKPWHDDLRTLHDRLVTERNIAMTIRHNMERYS